MTTGSNLQTVDQNLQLLKSIESGWGMPALPNAVKLDLATIGFPVAALQTFLTGLESDYEEATKPPPIATRRPDLVIPRSTSYGSEDPGRILYGVTGQGSPFKLDPGAVRTWKQRAVDQGYLELSDQEIDDPRWLPEYSYIASEMASDARGRRFSGEVPGSFSIPQIMDAVGEWLTPQGLYSAALGLDLWWDFENVGREVADWGQKWADYSKEWWNPLKLLDALTGPIDDIVLPVLNWGLMLVGVGEVYATGRVLYAAGKGANQAYKAARAIENVAGLYDGMRGVMHADRFLDGVHGAWVAGRAGNRAARFADIRRLQQAGMLSRGVRRLPGVGEGLAGGMESWRRLKSVTMAKKANQQIYRLGITSKIQGLVDERPGVSVASETEFDEWVQSGMDNWFVDLGVDMLFTPWNFFEPGGLRHLYGATGLKTVLTPVSKTVGNSIMPTVHKAFAPAADSDKLLAAFHNPTVRKLEKMNDGGEALARYQQDVSDVGVKQALANTWTGGNTDALGAAIAFTTVSAVIDTTARGLSRAGRELEEQMSRGTRAAYHAFRDTLVEQLRRHDSADLEEVFSTVSRYGNPEAVGGGMFDSPLVRPGTAQNEPAKLLQGKENVREFFLESVEDAAARAGAVPDRHVRLYRYRIAEGQEGLRWTDDLDTARRRGTGSMADDPAYVDVSVDEFNRWADNPEAAAMLAGEEVELPYQFWRRYLAGEDLHRVSGAAGHRVYDQTKLGNLRDMVDSHNQKRNQMLQAMFRNGTLDGSPSGAFDALEIYLDETLDTFTGWSEYFARWDAVDAALKAGQLDNVAMTIARSDLGRALGFHKGDPRWTEKMARLFFESMTDKNLGERLNKSIFSPLVREIDPSMGRFSLAKDTTKVKQDYLALYHRVNKMRKNLAAIRDLSGSTGKNAVAKSRAAKWSKIAKQMDESRGTIPAKEIVDNLAEELLIGSDETKRELVRLIELADDLNIPMHQLEQSLVSQLGHELNQPYWVMDYNIPTQIFAEETPDVAVRAKAMLDELLGQSNFVAAAVDAPEELAEYLAAGGYRLVYGVEFLTPHDVLDVIPELGTATRAQLRTSRLEQFFTRHSNDYMRARKSQIQRSELIASFGKWAGDSEQVAKSGPVRLRFGETADEAGADIDRVISDLWDIVDDRGAHLIAEKDRILDEGGTWTARLASNFASSRIPQSIEELPTALTPKQFKSALKGKGYNDTEIKAISEALMRSKKMSYEDYGLFNIEMHMRSRPQLVQGLRLLGRHRASDKFLAPKNLPAHLGTSFGTLAGGALGASQYQEIDPEAGGWETVLKGAIPGAIAGNMAATAGAKALYKGRGIELAEAGGAFNNMAAKLEHSDWMKYAYLADNLVNLRDRMRFTLSPIFDASRYSEAAIMSQAERLPPGVRLRLDQSPRSFRRRRAKELVATTGMDVDDARKMAVNEWRTLEAEFQNISRRDFDWTATDATSRRFASVGILGFSPTHWMTSTWAQLRQADVDPWEAYEIVRNIHTYGTRARSAAELSTNFVFFPFSFTKKVAGSMARYMTDDMSRLMMLHDGLKAYELLSEHYDLEEKWRAYLPILDRMKRLNVLAYGLGLGRFGGVNASLIEAAGAIPGVGSALGAPSEVGRVLGLTDEDLDIDSITNLFIPQLVNIEGSGADDLWTLVQRAFPAMNDWWTLTESLIQQGRVAASPSHMTAFAEAQRGWDEWREYQDMLTEGLQARGMTWEQAMRNESFANMVRLHRAGIAQENPAWIQQLGDGVSHQVILQTELTNRTVLTKNALAAGLTRDQILSLEGISPGDIELAQFKDLMDRAQATSLDWDQPETVPPELYGTMRRLAVKLGQEEPEFVRLYNRFYRRLLGDITTEMY